MCLSGILETREEDIMQNRVAVNRATNRKQGRRRMRLIAPGLFLMLPAIGIGGASFAQAAHVVQARLAALDAKPLRWDKPQAMQLSGVPVYVKTFLSSGPAVQAAQSLAAHADIFQRVLTAKNKIVLSGMEPDWHWLAEIEPTAEGAKGYVSALYVDAKYLSPSGEKGNARFEWLPPRARKQFGQDISIKSQTVAQHVYSIALAPQDLSTYVDQKLRSQGWASELTVTDMEGASAWRRKQARLMLFPHASAVGTSLFVHYVE